MSRTQATLVGKRCLCSACGEHFSTDRNFDRHRQGDHKILRVCADPATLGMVIKQSGPSTFWAMPGKEFVRRTD